MPASPMVSIHRDMGIRVEGSDIDRSNPGDAALQ